MLQAPTPGGSEAPPSLSVPVCEVDALAHAGLSGRGQVKFWQGELCRASTPSAGGADWQWLSFVFSDWSWSRELWALAEQGLPGGDGPQLLEPGRLG